MESSEERDAEVAALLKVFGRDRTLHFTTAFRALSGNTLPPGKTPRGSKEGHPPALGGPPPFGRWSPFPGRSSKTFLSFFLFLWRRCRRPWRLLALSGAAMVCKVW